MSFVVTNIECSAAGLAADKPEELATMKDEWDAYQLTYNVVLPEGQFKVRPPGKIPTEWPGFS